jgi:anti-sigma factor RsiW
MPNPIPSGAEPHDQAEELLPWYVTGQLDADDRLLVEQHLSSCAHCRRQLAFERRMVDEFVTMTPQVDTGWARLRQRIEPPRHAPPRASLWDKVARDAHALWETLSRPAVAALATAQLAIIGVAGTLVSLSQPAYQTLGSAPPPQSANVIAMFRGDTSESELRALLQTNGASLVGGPTSTDAYLLQVPATSRPAVLGKLQSDRHVLMAQAIDGSGS